MTENEIDFDDVSLEPTTSVDDLLDPVIKDTETTEVKVEDKPEPKKRRQAKKIFGECLALLRIHSNIRKN